MIISLAACGVLASLCIGFGKHFDDNDNPINNSMKSVLKQSKNLNYSYIKEICQIFIQSFDSIYSDTFKHPKISHYLWTSIFICWGTIFFLTLILHLDNNSTNTIPSTLSLLLASSFFGPMFAIVGLFYGSIGFEESIPMLNTLFDYLVYTIKCKCKVKINTYDESKIGQSSLTKCIFASVIWAIFIGMCMMAMGIVVQLAPKSMLLNSGYPDFPLFHMGNLEFIKLHSIACLMLSVFVFFPAAYMYIVFSVMKKYKSLFKISPLIIIFSSFITILLFSLIKYDLVISFTKNDHRLFLEFFPLFFLNILADSLSILETRYMLSKAISGSERKLIIFLFLDFLISSLIYLLVPILNGDLTLFLNAILFNGEMAWAGIFYWSSLFTSLFLYLYIIGFFILHLLYRCSNIKYFANRPSHALGPILAVIVLIIYLLPAELEVIIPTLLCILCLALLALLLRERRGSRIPRPLGRG